MITWRCWSKTLSALLATSKIVIRVLATDVPAIEAYPRAATRGLPVHRVEHRQPAGRVAPAALDTMRALASELFPQWQDRLAQVSGRPQRPLDPGRPHGERT